MRQNTFEGIIVTSEPGKTQQYGSCGGGRGEKGEEPLSGLDGGTSCVPFEAAVPLGQNGLFPYILHKKGG